MVGIASAADNTSSLGLTDVQINDQDNQLSAIIRYTTGGVPHITAANLESVAFGSGYVQARANVCIIADTILEVRSQRARFYGPGSGDSNIISDFSIKALGVMAKAKATYDQSPPAAKAMLRGFVVGYNKYLSETDSSQLSPRCAGQPWVRSITPQQLYAYYRLVALYGGSYNFLGLIFMAAPPATDPRPTLATDVAPAADGNQPSAPLRNIRPMVAFDLTRPAAMASNGWGIGAKLTANGHGALLANPHYPYTGNRRFFQSQLRVPGVYNVNGGSLIGFVIPQIGFNRHVAWTHTVSWANHFTFYALQLKDGHPMMYIKDGQAQPITTKTVRIQVATPNEGLRTLKKTFYYSEYGPIVNAHLIADALPEWGSGPFMGKPNVAFTYRDAGMAALSEEVQTSIQQWLAMGMADNLKEFKAAFAPCGNVLFVNTMYADAAGNAFYIDASAVPNLSAATLAAFRQHKQSNPAIAALVGNGIVILDGSTSRDDWVDRQCNGLMPYSGYPKLTRRDYVQNSNGSYWATNLNTLDQMTHADYSPVYGPVDSAVSARTRMGLKLLTQRKDPGLSSVKPAGEDGLFTGREIIEMLYSNRAYYPEMMLDDLLQRCRGIGDDFVTLADGKARRVDKGCDVLADWDGVYNTDSRGAAVFRVFVGHYDDQLPDAFTVSFDPDKPAATPRQPPEPTADLSQDPMLQALAQGLNALDKVGIGYDTKLGDVQYEAVEQGTRLPWPGTANVEGGFNIVRPYEGAYTANADQPKQAPNGTPVGPMPNTGKLSSQTGQGWPITAGTSWHFGLLFTDSGPQAWGLLSYSQSTNPASAHYLDQDKAYSNKDYRKILYSEQEIRNDPNLTTLIISSPAYAPTR